MATVIGHTAGTAAAGTTNVLDWPPDEAALQPKADAWLRRIYFPVYRDFDLLHMREQRSGRPTINFEPVALLIFA